MEEINDRFDNITGCNRGCSLVCDFNVQLTDPVEEQSEECLVSD